MSHTLLKVVECVYAVYYQGGGSEGLSVGADSSFSADSSVGSIFCRQTTKEHKVRFLRILQRSSTSFDSEDSRGHLLLLKIYMEYIIKLLTSIMLTGIKLSLA